MSGGVRRTAVLMNADGAGVVARDRGERDREQECRPFAPLAPDLDRPALPRDQIRGDSQAEPDAVLPPLTRLHELLEYPGLILRRDTLARVPHPEAGERAVGHDA